LAKITKLDAALVVDEQVARLNIPVHEPGGVHEIDSAEKVVHYYFDVLLGQAVALDLVEHSSNVVRYEFHYYEDPFCLLEVIALVGDVHIHQFGNENVLLHLCELPEDLQLSDDISHIVGIAKVGGDALDGAQLPRLALLGLHDLTEGALADDIEEFVLGLDLLPLGGQLGLFVFFLVHHFFIIINYQLL